MSTSRARVPRGFRGLTAQKALVWTDCKMGTNVDSNVNPMWTDRATAPCGLAGVSNDCATVSNVA
eukprot:1724364-Lingulodinium_polyedra.AAC.1